MAKLYFRYGVMGSSKTANALMVRYNYQERGQEALLVKPAVDQRDGARFVASRAGLSSPCIYFSDLQAMTVEQLRPYACVIVDEAQFLSPEEVAYLVCLVDEVNLPVICYGLRTDFKGDLFPGSMALLAAADVIEEVKTICWCGKKATCNARFDSTGRVLKEGEQVVLGANDRYIGLCRKHWREGNLGPGHTLPEES
ncbi:MAG: thymidine kinase [Oscillospiraceae bacterium]|nr:thymidine kinase [Oscillospiraceae bacterium]